ncbi:MAG: DUF448 domain-containing protein [Polyangiaceae bacterium]
MQIIAKTKEEHPRGEPGTRGRTCVGCGEKDHPSAFVRLVLSPEGDVAVDAGNGSFGRGAHVHPRPDCVTKACKGGIARTMKTNVRVTPAELATQMVDALDRRMEGLVLAARRTNALAIGADAACEALGREAPLVIVARDAGSVIEKMTVADAIAEGRAVGWGTKERIGALLGRSEVAIAAVTSKSIAAEMMKVCAGKDAVSGVSTEKPASKNLGSDVCRTPREAR